MAVYDLAHKLADHLQKSEEYQDYSRLREQVMQDEKTRKMIREYQSLSFKANTAQSMGQETGEKDRERLEQLEELINMNTAARKFLQAEARLGVMLQDVQKIIMQDLELGLEEIDGEE